MKLNLFNVELTMIINAVEQYAEEYADVKNGEYANYNLLLNKLTTAQEILIKEGK